MTNIYVGVIDFLADVMVATAQRSAIVLSAFRSKPMRCWPVAATNRGAIKTIATHYIDGAFAESHGREVMDIIRPQDGQVIARVTLADEEDTRRAIAAAKRAFADYGRSTTEERAKILRRLHEAASARLDDLTAAIVEEYGGVVQFAGLIVQSGVNAFLAAEKALQEMPWTRSQDDRDTGAGRSGRFDYRLECECIVHLPKAGLGGCRGLHGRYQAQWPAARDERTFLRTFAIAPVGRSVRN